MKNRSKFVIKILHGNWFLSMYDIGFTEAKRKYNYKTQNVVFYKKINEYEYTKIMYSNF